MGARNYFEKNFHFGILNQNFSFKKSAYVLFTFLPKNRHRVLYEVVYNTVAKKYTLYMFLHKEYRFFSFALAPILLIDPIILAKIAPNMNMNNVYIHAGEVIWKKF